VGRLQPRLPHRIADPPVHRPRGIAFPGMKKHTGE